ncbi:helix-hairpin-helix domain-containing protein [Haloferax sp. YSSS75]|uniref:helix-hairpin-helix domain-containing protein n=1 Tax=Haloferax sp. YSSS75 TaxID=3388564 RepID=UPI00398C8FE8
MKVVLTDGTTFTCGGYKALDSGGVVLTDDPKRKHVIGYVPEASLAYILPDGVEPGGNGEGSDDSESEESEENDELDGGGDDGHEDDGDGSEEDDEDERTDADSDDEHEDERTDADSDDEHEDEGEHEDADDSDEYSHADDEDDEVADEAVGTVSDEDDEVSERVVSAGVEPTAEGVTSVASDDVVGEHTHEDVVERVEQLESRVDGLDGRVDAMTEQLADVVARGTVAEDEVRSPEDVRNIRGIGEAYATRLRASGIDTVAALSEASDAEITAAVDVSERRASEWRRRAKTAVESDVTDDV